MQREDQPHAHHDASASSPEIRCALLTGILGTLLSVGGAGIVIPLLIDIFGFSQHQAQSSAPGYDAASHGGGRARGSLKA
jgi:hypothetical protein